jgi:hypothetical protein
MKIHHLGIVVTDVDEALTALGLNRSCISEKVYDPNQKNNLYFIHMPDNNMWLELVEPTSKDSTTAKFASKFSLGLHHLGFSPDDLKNTEKTYTARPGNFCLGRYKINVKSFGEKIQTMFIAVKGLMLEFVKVEKQ